MHMTTVWVKKKFTQRKLSFILKVSYERKVIIHVLKECYIIIPNRLLLIFVWYVFTLGWTGGIVCAECKQADLFDCPEAAARKNETEHEWFKSIWREETKKSFGRRYLNIEKKIPFLDSWVSALSYDTSIKNNELGMTKFCLCKVVLAFP